MANVVANPLEKKRHEAADKVAELFDAYRSETLYLYLIDEEAGEPVVGAKNYPIVIKSSSEEAKVRAEIGARVASELTHIISNTNTTQQYPAETRPVNDCRVKEFERRQRSCRVG